MTLINCTPWGEMANGPAYLFRLTNSSGAFVELTNYGATIVSIHVHDRNGRLGNVILGYDNLQGYMADTNYMGATIGRFANRIAGAAFELEGSFYQLEANDGVNTNHGGHSGFHGKVFSHEIDENSIIFRYISPDGEGGFPGTLQLTVTYQWTEGNALLIRYHATTDQPTIANFTNHAYFNLSGEKSGIDDHKLRIYSDNIVEANPHHIPTGLILPAGALTFNGGNVGQKIAEEDGRRTGLNTCYVLNKQNTQLHQACQLADPKTGRNLTIHTSYPGILLYTGDYITGETHQPFGGLCLECQYFPDSPNQATFPDTILRPGEFYDHSIQFHFN
ncbi:galactose mutarotase [Dyadobacter sp. CY261]|uniref:aldose epimerase family protein n=1 Tax=Dyadobacter sp. CY261 TaxID=2907203 RepID=UPI001F19503E|nr:aldose epimerase family protein [Dyadobacter sp. CY261]MCF0069347.1 galactose mutarotase [Dyadobacter sp. CY261]